MHREKRLTTIGQVDSPRVMRFLSHAVFAASVLAGVAWLPGALQSPTTAGKEKHPHFPNLFISEADDGFVAEKGREPATDFLERHSRLLIGADGIDCGRVGIRDDPTSATKCALRAQAARKPFRVRYDDMGADSAVAEAMVRTPAGRLSALRYDADPAGAGGHLHGIIWPRSCPEHAHLWVKSNGRISCFAE